MVEVSGADVCRQVLSGKRFDHDTVFNRVARYSSLSLFISHFPRPPPNITEKVPNR